MHTPQHIQKFWLADEWAAQRPKGLTGKPAFSSSSWKNIHVESEDVSGQTYARWHYA